MVMSPEGAVHICRDLMQRLLLSIVGIGQRFGKEACAAAEDQAVIILPEAAPSGSAKPQA